MPDISPGHGQALTQMTMGGNSESSLQILLWVKWLQHAPVIDNMNYLTSAQESTKEVVQYRL